MVGSSIRKLREGRNITQKDLADWLGVSRQAISMWESGKRELKATMLNKIANTFGVTLDEIVRIQKSPIFDNTFDLSTRRKIKSIEFRFPAPTAKKVVVTGDFNSWSSEGVPLKKNKEGIWKTKLDLASGRYEYKFIVDGHWCLDPQNSSTALNPMGIPNSVKEINI